MSQGSSDFMSDTLGNVPTSREAPDSPTPDWFKADPAAGDAKTGLDALRAHEERAQPTGSMRAPSRLDTQVNELVEVVDRIQERIAEIAERIETGLGDLQKRMTAAQAAPTKTETAEIKTPSQATTKPSETKPPTPAPASTKKVAKPGPKD